MRIKHITLINIRIKEIREEFLMTQDEFAKFLGVKRCSIAAYEEFRSQFPIKLIPKLMDISGIEKDRMYDLFFNKEVNTIELINIFTKPYK